MGGDPFFPLFLDGGMNLRVRPRVNVVTIANSNHCVYEEHF